MPIISIIGSSGRKNELTGEMFYKALDRVKAYIDEMEIPKSEITLRSGGSSGMDHIAVLLYKKGEYRSLILNFPCNFVGSSFISTGCGSMLNKLHKDFSNLIGRDSLQDIRSSLFLRGVTWDSSPGFFARNDKVAECDILISLTGDKGDRPKSGGTKYTWDKSKAPTKIHITLED